MVLRDGKRVQKSNACPPWRGKLYWYGMGSDPLVETDAAGNNPVEYVFFGGKRIARRDSVGTVSYYFADHLGTSRIVFNATGAVQDDADFYPFGKERPYTSSSGNNYKFTGKERDSESGLDNFGARFDASTLGRFMSPDPLMASATVYDPRTWNRYTYALNNPLRFIDPTGMKEESAEDCKKDPQCTTVKVNVIYDTDANLTDEQKTKFKQQAIQEAKDEYGDAHIHLDVTETTGGFDTKGNLVGAAKDSINVLVGDSGDEGVSGMTKNGYALTKININLANKETLAHELAHHFMGDTTGLVSKTAGWIMSSGDKDASTIAALLVLVPNALADYNNNGARRDLGRSMPWMHMGLDQNPSGIMPPLSAAAAFNTGGRKFQPMLTQQAIRPRQ